MFTENEHGQILNTDDGPLAALQDRLQQLGLHGVFRSGDASDPGADAFVQLSTGSGKTHTYLVERRRQLPPALATALPKHDPHPMLIVTSLVGERAAELLRAQGIDYIDEAGNAHIAWDDVLIDIRGRRGTAGQPTAPSPRGGKAFGRAGLQVGFTLLSWPGLAAEPMRHLASISGVSLGTTKMVIDELSRAGYLYRAAGERRLRKSGELLNRWSEAYSITLSPALLIGEFSAPEISWWRTSEDEFAELGIQIGGEAGASLLDSHLVPSTLTLYVKDFSPELVRRYRMARATHNTRNVHIRKKFWVDSEDSWIVPSTLLYADLLASGDPRQREHADRIRADDDRLVELDQH